MARTILHAGKLRRDAAWDTDGTVQTSANSARGVVPAARAIFGRRADWRLSQDAHACSASMPGHLLGRQRLHRAPTWTPLESSRLAEPVRGLRHVRRALRAHGAAPGQGAHSTPANIIVSGRGGPPSARGRHLAVRSGRGSHGAPTRRRHRAQRRDLRHLLADRLRAASDYHRCRGWFCTAHRQRCDPKHPRFR